MHLMRACLALLVLAGSGIALARPQAQLAPANSAHPQSQSTHTQKSLTGAQPSAPTHAAAPDADPYREIREKAMADVRTAHQADAPPLFQPSADPRYIQAYTDYLIWALDHDRATYHWHHVSSIIIFFVVIFLVLSGVWFSWMQFRHAHRIPAQAVAASDTSSTAVTPLPGGVPLAVTEEKDSVTEFSASPQGVKIASSAIGVVILVISMCFFYLYLDKVYPITVIPAGQSGPPTSSPR